MMLDLVQPLVDGFEQARSVLFESVVQPAVFGLGGGNLLEDAYDATGWLLVGLIQLVVMACVIAPLQRLRPVERVEDRHAVRVDVFYTLIHRLGLFRLALFFTLTPLSQSLFGVFRVWGLPTFHLESLMSAAVASPFIAFLLYLLVFDFVDYWIHRAQHNFSWWWQLHAVHHSQRQMTMWSDNRNHLLDDVLRDTIFVFVGLLIGVAPGQFVAIVACTQLLESLSHANVRMHFGSVLGRLIVSPRFHRRHHSIRAGEDGIREGHNFGVLFAFWDSLFGSAKHEDRYDATGIRDQLPGKGGRDYGRGFWAQQRLGVVRLLHSLRFTKA